MEKLLTEQIEATPLAPQAEPQGGFPFAGVGLGVLVVVVAVGIFKNYCRKS